MFHSSKLTVIFLSRNIDLCIFYIKIMLFSYKHLNNKHDDYSYKFLYNIFFQNKIICKKCSQHRLDSRVTTRDFLVDKHSFSKMARSDWVYDELLTFLGNPLFQVPVLTFMEANCISMYFFRQSP